MLSFQVFRKHVGKLNQEAISSGLPLAMIRKGEAWAESYLLFLSIATCRCYKEERMGFSHLLFPF